MSDVINHQIPDHDLLDVIMIHGQRDVPKMYQ